MVENRFYDYATGKEIRSNPEEEYRQLFEHILIDDLGYPKENIDIEVIIQRGSNITGEHVPSCFVIESAQILKDQSRRIDAWYWDTNKNNLAKSIEESVGNDVQEIVRLGDLVVEHGIFYPGRHKRNYVESSPESVPFYSGTQILQIRPFDLQYQPKDYFPAAKHFVEKDWILITRSGSTGRVVMVTDSISGSMVSEHVIRVICDEELVDPYLCIRLFSNGGYRQNIT